MYTQTLPATGLVKENLFFFYFCSIPISPKNQSEIQMSHTGNALL